MGHLRAGNETLSDLLIRNMVLAHPFVVGELALGFLRERTIILGAFSDLPQVNVATDQEVLQFIQRHRLFGRGIGYVNVHLLAAVRVTAGAELWTHDKPLHGVAGLLGWR